MSWRCLNITGCVMKVQKAELFLATKLITICLIFRKFLAVNDIPKES